MFYLILYYKSFGQVSYFSGQFLVYIRKISFSSIKHSLKIFVWVNKNGKIGFMISYSLMQYTFARARVHPIEDMPSACVTVGYLVYKPFENFKKIKSLFG